MPAKKPGDGLGMRKLTLADGGMPYHKGYANGGKVVGPGSGISDSVPARYSNGEYVLPADTAQHIGYDKLDAIKDATHTPAAAQRGLRGGADGQGQDGVSGGVQGWASGRAGAEDSYVAGMGNQDRVSLRDRLHNLEQVDQPKSLRLADGGIPGVDVLERPFTSADSRAFAAQPGPGNPNVGVAGSAEAQAFRQPAGVTAPTTNPTLRAGLAAETSGVGKAAYAGGRALAGVAKVAGALGPAAAGADVVSHFNDFKINDPSVDSSATGTFNALRNGDFSGAGRSLSKGALETGMDLGNFAANTLDYVVPGKAPVSTAYGNTLRNQFGDQLAPDSSVTAQAKATQTPAGTSTAGAGRGYVNPPLASTLPDQTPLTNNTLRGQAGAEVDGAPGVRKFVQDGKTLYSNSTTPGDNDALMNGRAGVSTVPGMSREAIAAELGGQSASAVSADNAIRAANLRDGVDINRGVGGNGPTMSVIGDGGGYGLLSKEYQAKRANDMAMGDVNNQSRTLRGQTLAYMGQQADNASRLAIAASGDATTRRGQDITGRVADAGNRLTARGQDITERDNMRTNQTSLTNSAASNKLGMFNALREQGNTDRTYGAGRTDAEFTQRQQSQKNLHEEIAGMLPATAEGKPDLDTAARYSTALNADLSAKEAQLTQDAKSGKSGAAAVLADWQTNKHGALSESYKRNFINGMKIKDLAEKYSTSRFNPTGGRAVLDDAPRTGLKKASNGVFGFGGSYTNDQGDDIPARAIEGDGSYIGGLRRNDLVRK